MRTDSFCELSRHRQVNILTRPLQVGLSGRDALDDQTVARMACGTQKRAVEQRAVAGVLYKRAIAAVTTATESTALTMAREREHDRGGKLAVEGAAVGS